jgi:hypothetical protein
MEINCSRSGSEGRGSTSGSSESEYAKIGSKKIMTNGTDMHNFPIVSTLVIAFIWAICGY